MPKFPIRDIDRFMVRVDISEETGCWNWTTGLLDGYGCFSLNGRGISAHRFSYMYFKGPIPEGLHIDHLCKNRRCCNPSHLEAVTQQENSRRSRGKRVDWRTKLQFAPEELERRIADFSL